MTREEAFNETYNPCDECDYSYSKNNQETGMCKICEFNKLLQEPERKWIPVSERLPEKDGYYFVTKRFIDGRIKTDIEPFWTGADWWKSEFHFDGIGLWEVLAWQPLPEPYKAGDQE